MVACRRKLGSIRTLRHPRDSAQAPFSHDMTRLPIRQTPDGSRHTRLREHRPRLRERVPSTNIGSTRMSVTMLISPALARDSHCSMVKLLNTTP